MSLMFATPEALTATASDVAGIGSTLGRASAAAAGPTTAVVAAAEDEISAQLAALFSRHGLAFQQLSGQLSAFHHQFVQALTSGAGAYSAAEADAARTLTNAVHAPAAAVTNASNALASAPAKLEGALSGGGGLGLLGGTGLLERAAQGVSQEFGALRQAGALLLTPTGGIRALTSAAGLLSPAATTAGNALAPLGNAIEAAYLTFEASVQYALELFQYAVQFVPYASVLASQITIFYNLIEPIVQATLFNVIDIIDQTVTISQGLTNFWTATTAAVNQFIRAEFSQFLPPLPPLPPLPHFP